METNQSKYNRRITADINEDDFDIEAESEAYFDDDLYNSSEARYSYLQNVLVLIIFIFC